MKKEIIAIAAVAMLSGMAFASCGSDVQEDSVSVALPKVTVASGEQTTTSTGATTTADTKTTATAVSASTSKTTDSDDDGKETETTTVEKEEKTEDVPIIEPTEKPTEAPAQTPVSSAYSFGFSDLMSGSALSALGSPNYTGVSPACTTSGSDITVYEYNGLTVQTFDNGGSEAICSITIKSDNYSAGGVTIGSSRSDVISAFGGDGSFYSEGNKELSFSYNGDSVSSIMFYYPA